MNIIISGGAGFIGSALIRYLIAHTEHTILNIDKLTYASNINSLSSVVNSPRYFFQQVDICNQNKLIKIVKEFKPQAIMHLAAESHVDRSIDSPTQFMQSNIIGTYTLLEATLTYWQTLNTKEQANFRFHHISTDEVYGNLSLNALPCTEDAPYHPSSPYSASKAASDHLVYAWYKTYALPVVISHCSNNYGPCQFPEKLIPLIILNAIANKPLTLYGNGQQIRDWIYIEDHIQALVLVLTHGKIGERYNIGGGTQITNLDVVNMICNQLEIHIPVAQKKTTPLNDLIIFVPDRPGHDTRYAINNTKIKHSLNWQPQESFESGLNKTIQWYLNNKYWWQPTVKNINLREKRDLNVQV